MPFSRQNRLTDGRWGSALLALLVAAVTAGGVGFALRRTPADPTVGGPTAPEPPGAPPSPVESSPSPEARARLVAARAIFTCSEQAGEAVFLAPDRAVTTIPCAASQGQVRFSDGRDLLARVLPGAPPGTAWIEIPGAAARSVPIGEASALQDGSPLLVGIEGAGIGTLGAVTARGFANRAGLPLLRLEGGARPIAGPVADAQGRVVAVVPATPPDPEHPWLAVPMEAFPSSPGTEVAPAWKAAAGRAADEDRRSLGELWNRLHERTVLLSATPGPDGLALVVARASAGRPPSETVRLAVDPVARDCNPSGRIVEWRVGPRALDGLPVPAEVAASLTRMEPPPSGGSVWIGSGLARLDCDLSRVARGATLAIPDTDPLAPVPFPVAQLVQQGTTAPPPHPPPPPEEALAAASAAEEAAASEVGWRQAFREANARLAQAKQRRIDLQAQRDAAHGNFQYALEQQLDGDVEGARLEERRADEALNDLDRRASLAAVPREWRRPTSPRSRPRRAGPGRPSRARRSPSRSWRDHRPRPRSPRRDG